MVNDLGVSKHRTVHVHFGGHWILNDYMSIGCDKTQTFEIGNLTSFSALVVV
jgi:hypothetical protein